MNWYLKTQFWFKLQKAKKIKSERDKMYRGIILDRIAHDLLYDDKTITCIRGYEAKETEKVLNNLGLHYEKSEEKECVYIKVLDR